MRSVVVVHQAPGDEGQVAPHVDVGARHHEMPVRNVAPKIKLCSVNVYLFSSLKCYMLSHLCCVGYLGMGHLLNRQASQFSL